jgi:hypothetical protein
VQRASQLADAVTYTKGAFEFEAFAAAATPVLDESLTPPLTKAYPLLEKEDPEQVRREAQHAAAFEAKMEADRQLLEERHLAKDAVTKAALMELLGKPTPGARPTPGKAKRAEDLTCRACCGKYTDARDRRGRRHQEEPGFCSRTCRAAKGKCDHGRRKRQCKDCGTGYCKHGRQKGKCEDCGTGHCEHGRQLGKCKDCGTGCYCCVHNRRKGLCKDCK